MGPLVLLLTACAPEEPEELCRGTRYQDIGDDGVIDDQTALVLDSQHRTLSESSEWEGHGLVTTTYTYDETGLVEELSLLEEEVISWVIYERRPDGQPLRMERWEAWFEQGVETTVFEYDGDLLSQMTHDDEVTTYTYDEHGRRMRIEVEGPMPFTVERWYSEPAPSLDGGHRTFRWDGALVEEMEQWYDGELLVADRGYSQPFTLDRTWTWREDGQLASSVSRSEDGRFVSLFSYDHRGLPTWSYLHAEVDEEAWIGEDGASRTRWEWRCAD
jgi:YD repeat-containing protein